MRFQKITLLGVGLLGGSLGLAVKRGHLATRVCGYVRRAESVQECLSYGVVDEATIDLARAVESADLLIFCTPIAQMAPMANKLIDFLKPGALVTDVGSVKSSVVRDLEPVISQKGGLFVGSHPMAGSEKTGVRAARTDLFDGAVCVITPSKRSNPGATALLEDFWRQIGSRTIQMSPEVHDELVSRSSHLPHLAAAILAQYILDPAHGRDQALLCASGFRDTTRVASGSPEMWRDISMANRENLVRVLAQYIESLQRLRAALEAGDQQEVIQSFEMAKQRRDQWDGSAAGSSVE